MNVHHAKESEDDDEGMVYEDEDDIPVAYERTENHTALAPAKAGSLVHVVRLEEVHIAEPEVDRGHIDVVLRAELPEARGVAVRAARRPAVARGVLALLQAERG